MVVRTIVASILASISINPFAERVERSASRARLTKVSPSTVAKVCNHARHAAEEAQRAQAAAQRAQASAPAKAPTPKPKKTPPKKPPAQGDLF